MESNLSCLKKQVDALQSTPFEEGAAHFRPLVYNLGLIWARCPGFNETNDHFRRIANLLNNMVIVEVSQTEENFQTLNVFGLPRDELIETPRNKF